MITKFNTEQTITIMNMLADLVNQAADELGALDAILGDGDLGISMGKGFGAVRKKLEQVDSAKETSGSVLALAGTTLASAAPSTLGTLLGWGFLKAGNRVKDVPDLDLDNLAVFCRIMVETISLQGRAHVGDKTILDALNAGADALDAAAKQGESLEQACHSARAAAWNGFKDTIDLQAKQGRAGRYFERSVGYKDAGALMGVLIFEAFSHGIDGFNAASVANMPS